MLLEPGTQIGPYELRGVLGEGGMGVVYRAHDDRLQRDVAIKFMSQVFSGDSTRTRLMQQEARAASKLSHPNIVTVFDVGTHAGLMYVVTELLEGESLRKLVERGPTPWRVALGLAVQIADGLAAAHEHGIVHRDIKPDNVFLTNEGRVKILDFGVATLRPTDKDGLTSATAQTVSQGGLLVGTVGYMSPEQTRGEKVDQRSDLFAFGCLLYELLTGKPTFEGASPISVLAAIQRDTPVPLDEVVPTLRHDVARVVDRCLEKDPAKRFPSARELAFSLRLIETGRQAPPEAALVATPRSPENQAPPPIAERPSISRRALLWFGAALVADSAVSVAAVRAFGTKAPPSPAPIASTSSSATSVAPPPLFRQITYRRGTVYTARFTPDGSAVVYSAAWDGNLRDLFVTVPGTHEARSLAQQETDVAWALTSGDIVVIKRSGASFSKGVLSRLSLAGGPPKAMVDEVRWADGSVDGAQVVVLRKVDGKAHLEMPPGKAIVETSRVAYVRLSPDGTHVAFLEYSGLGEDAGKLVVVDATGKRIVESADHTSIEGVAWRTRDEIWFTGAKEGRALSMFGIDLKGQTRLLCRTAGRLVLHDLSVDGRAVAERNTYRSRLIVGQAKQPRESDLSWQDYSQLAQLSRDGTHVLFSEEGEGAAPGTVAYLRPIDGGPPLRLGDGAALALSLDSTKALIRMTAPTLHLEVVPVGAGTVSKLPVGALRSITWAAFVPGGAPARIVMLGREEGKPDRLYLQDLDAGDPRAFGDEGVIVSGDALSPDGKLVAAKKGDAVLLVPLDGGATRTLPGLGAAHDPVAWSTDGRSLFVRGSAWLPIEVLRYDVATAKLEPWRKIEPADVAGVIELGRVSIARDGEVYAYESYQLLSDLFVIENLV